MTQPPIVSIDFFPDFSALTDSALESLCDQAFAQLEDGPLIEGLFGFYLSLQTELEERQSLADRRPGAPAPQQLAPQPVSA